MPAQAKRKVLTRGLALWRKPRSAKIWIEAGKKWAGVIVKYDAWGLATMIRLLIPFPFGLVLGQLVMVIVKWHSKKLKKYVGPRGIWIGFNPSQFVGLRQNSIAWWKRVDARPRTKSNMKKEPTPW